MIRSSLKHLARRVLGRSTEDAPAPTAPPPLPEVEQPEVPELEIDQEQVGIWLNDGQPVAFLDIREPRETRHGYASEAQLMPMNDVPDRLDDLPGKDTRLVVYCAAGARSYGVVGYLRQQGWDDAWSLVGGFSALANAGAEVTRPDKPA